MIKGRGKGRPNNEAERTSLGELLKKGVFVPDRGEVNKNLMPGGPVVGHIVGADPSRVPVKVIFRPAAGPKSVPLDQAGGVEKLKDLFRKNNLRFPWIPEELAAQLRERREWVYSTRPIRKYPYYINAFFKEAECGVVDDYVVIGHDGHGVNSYALHYFIVYGPLSLFLQLGWGGVYMDAKKAREEIRRCFGVADKIVKIIAQVFRSPENSQMHEAFNDISIMVYCSDFYGRRWYVLGAEDRKTSGTGQTRRAYDCLCNVLEWVRNRRRYAPNQRGKPRKRLWTIAEVLSRCNAKEKAILERVLECWQNLGHSIQKGFGSIRLRALVKGQSILLCTLDKDPARINLVWDHLRRNRTFPASAIDAYQSEVNKLAKLDIGKNWACLPIDKDFTVENAERLARAMHALANAEI